MSPFDVRLAVGGIHNCNVSIHAIFSRIQVLLELFIFAAVMGELMRCIICLVALCSPHLYVG